MVTRGHLRHSGIGKLMRPKLQKQSVLKLAGRIIPQSGGYKIPVVTRREYKKNDFVCQADFDQKYG